MGAGGSVAGERAWVMVVGPRRAVSPAQGGTATGARSADAWGDIDGAVPMAIDQKGNSAASEGPALARWLWARYVPTTN